MELLTKFLSWLIGLFLVLVLFFILGDIIFISMDKISLDFMIESPSSAGRAGGIFPIIISTLLILLVAIIVTFPIGLASALYLSEYGLKKNRYVKIVRKAVEILSSVPSIVYGLFGNALFSIYFGLGFSILSGGLTLALMSLPLFITTVEKGLSSVPTKYRLVGMSLNMSRFTMVMTIFIPYALPSIIVGLILSIGRSLAETAALIFTSGYVDRMPESVFDSGRSLSIHIYDLSMNVPGGDTNAYKTSFVLIMLILLLNSSTSFLLGGWYKKRIAIK